MMLFQKILEALAANPHGLTTREVGRAVGVPCSLALARMARPLGQIARQGRRWVLTNKGRTRLSGGGQ